MEATWPLIKKRFAFYARDASLINAVGGAHPPDNTSSSSPAQRRSGRDAFVAPATSRAAVVSRNRAGGSLCREVKESVNSFD